MPSWWPLWRQTNASLCIRNTSNQLQVDGQDPRPAGWGARGNGSNFTSPQPGNHYGSALPRSTSAGLCGCFFKLGPGEVGIGRGDEQQVFSLSHCVVPQGHSTPQSHVGEGGSVATGWS